MKFSHRENKIKYWSVLAIYEVVVLHSLTSPGNSTRVNFLREIFFFASQINMLRNICMSERKLVIKLSKEKWEKKLLFEMTEQKYAQLLFNDIFYFIVFTFALLLISHFYYRWYGYNLIILKLYIIKIQDAFMATTTCIEVWVA